MHYDSARPPPLPQNCPAGQLTASDVEQVQTVLKLALWNRLCEHISRIISSSYFLHLDSLLTSQKMIPYVNMLGSLMMDLILG